eukprot:TRINITY_DN805_c0_g1_i1.p1 TRINITY_DN805_c0_g1~~TRINITY_DN805_c0_g1_i1.p1  ORF type:complete len:233 (+),score=72.90 TRINITY_DN805_c0_g1_i1:97-795(+)
MSQGKLWVYEHCPFCIRVRLVSGVKKLPITVEYFLNDNEEDPIRMVGAKQVPILEYQVDGVTKFMPESLDIAKFLDANWGDAKNSFAPAENEDLKKWIDETSDVRARLCLPRWPTQTSFPEFKTESAQKYFINKKEAMKGPFAELIASTDVYLKQLQPHLEKLANDILKSADGKDGVNGKGRIDFDDVMLWPWLINLSVVKGFQEIAPQKVKNYIQYLCDAASFTPFYQTAL